MIWIYRSRRLLRNDGCKDSFWFNEWHNLAPLYRKLGSSMHLSRRRETTELIASWLEVARLETIEATESIQRWKEPGSSVSVLKWELRIVMPFSSEVDIDPSLVSTSFWEKRTENNYLMQKKLLRRIKKSRSVVKKIKKKMHFRNVFALSSFLDLVK